MANERREGKGRRATDTKQALLEAAQSALESEAEHQRELRKRSPKQRRKIMPAVYALLVAFSTYALLTRPAWLQAPPPPPDTPAVREANLRLTMYTQAIRVHRFVEENGRLPETLGEANATGVGTRLEPLDDNQFVIHGDNGTIELRLGSTDQMREFLGDSFEVLATRGRS